MSTEIHQIEPIFLLQTKLYCPQAPPDLIHRPHLIDRLNQGLNRKLTLIAAPAGYGKTTIVTQWLDNLPTQTNQHTISSVAWFSLDETDNNLILFVQYLVAAIRQHQPGGCTTTLAALSNPQPPPWSQLAILLLNDLLSLTKPLILVLDDYHFIVEEEIHQFLDRLLDHLPPLLHLVLISRTEPPLSLPRLRVRQQMNELRTADLSFSDAETEQYLTQDSSNAVTPATVSALQERSQGWIAGLYLTKLSLGRNRNEEALLKQLQASNSHIMDYLLTEVLAQQETAVQTFLLHTAILRRFCLPLCEALLGSETLATDDFLSDHRQPSIPYIIDSLARHHLFTIPLDDSGDWYRYHHLFQLMLTRLLQKQVSASQINSLHQKASRWFAQEGLIDEALYHAQAADDLPFAVHLIEQHRLRMLNQFQYHTLERWLSLLPEGTVAQHPSLLLLECWLSVSSYRLTPMLQRIQQVETLLENNQFSLDETDQTILQAEITAIRGVSYFWVNDFQQTILCYRQAIVDLPDSYLFMRTHIILLAAFAFQILGQTSKAIYIIQKEVQNTAAPPSSLPIMWLKSYLVVIHYMTGNLQLVLQTAKETIKQLDHQPRHKAFIASLAHRWLGTIYYERNELTTARHHFLQVDSSNSTPYLNSHLFLALSYEVTGQPHKADQIIDNLQRWSTSLNSEMLRKDLASFEARRLYLQGKHELALNILGRIKFENIVNVSMPGQPALTQIKILLAQAQKSSWQKAKIRLEELWSLAAEKGQNIPAQIEILAHQALLYQRQEKLDEALIILEQSIKLGKPRGFIRTYLDLGKPMATLLYQLLQNGVEPDYVGQLLAAFPQIEPNHVPVRHINQAAQAELIEPLTNREMDVLLLLAQELSNKKIAQQLSISPLTVKRHTINIYKKLSVTSRYEAASTARTLGLLSIAAKS